MNTKILALSLSITILSTIGAHAQINHTDSTVNIVAYWQPMEKYSYQCTADKYEVSAKGDTVYTDRNSEIRTFEVISETKDSYELSMTYSDFWSIDPTEL